MDVPRKLIAQQDQREPPAGPAGPARELARRRALDRRAETIAYLAIALGLLLRLRRAEPDDHPPLELGSGHRRRPEPVGENLLRAGHLKAAARACRAARGTITPFENTEREGELGTSGYRISNAYQFGASRTQIECTLPNGQTYSNIEVVSGEYAWDEDIPGAGLVQGKGTATPMPDELDERLIRLWASPQGAPKAALAGAGIDRLKVFRNPGGLLEEGTSKIGETSVTWDGDTPVVTFPIPGVEGATAVARLDDRFMTESVVVTHGDDTYEFTYGDYNDYNNPLNKVEVYMAGTMTETKNGEVMRQIRTVQTETGSVYVVVPVPPSVGQTEPLPQFGSD